MSALDIAPAAFELLPGLNKAGKLYEALSALGTLLPLALGGTPTAKTVLDLHASGKLVEIADALSTLIKDVDAVLTVDPSQAAHVTALLVAAGLKAS